MKKVKVTFTIILKNGNRREIKVWLEDEIYASLLQTGDKTLLNAYLLEEYKTRCLERKETRRHISSEYLAEKGVEFAADDPSQLETVLRSEQQEKVKAALRTLTERQLLIVTQYIYERKSFREIGDFLGIHKESVRIQYLKALKKLSKFFNFGLSKDDFFGE